MRAHIRQFRNSAVAAVFNWHQVTPRFDPERHYKTIWTPLDRFETALVFIVDNFTVISAFEMVARLKRGKALTENIAALTFDDGDVSLAEHVVPGLARRGLPATLFLNSAYLDNATSYWVPILSYLAARPDLLGAANLPASPQEVIRFLRTTADRATYNRLREQVEASAPLVPDLKSRLVSSQWLATLDPRQFSIGCHGHEHQRYAMMTPEWQRADLQRNVDILSCFRAYRPLFAVPFGRAGDWSEETTRICGDLGLDIVYADSGINAPGTAGLKRIPSDGAAFPELWTELVGS